MFKFGTGKTWNLIYVTLLKCTRYGMYCSYMPSKCVMNWKLNVFLGISK